MMEKKTRQSTRSDFEVQAEDIRCTSQNQNKGTWIKFLSAVRSGTKALKLSSTFS